MAKKGLTLEQKKKVPRKLRGAGVRRHWCPICDEWHPYPRNRCKNHPDYERIEKKRREGASRSGRAMVESGHFDKMNRILAEKRMDPKWRAEDSARRSKVRKNKKRTGPNPMQGRHHTPEAKAKIGAATSKRHSTYTTADLLRLHAPPMPAPTAFDFFRTTSPPPPPPEKRDEFTGGYYVEDIFGNDEFDPFH